VSPLPSSLVVDSSVAVKWWIAEADSALATSLTEGRTLIAPDFLSVECANILWKHVRRGEITQATATAALMMLQAAPISRTRDTDLVSDAQRLSADLDHPVYDCLYLALALRHGIPVVTADRRFAALAERSRILQGALIPLSALA
jgi:predicted nucleic acid-binding protein